MLQSQVRFYRVPEKVWEVLVQSQVRFNTVGFRKRLVRLNKVPGKFPEKVWKVLMQSQVRFNRIPCGEGLGGFGAEPG